ncbi:SE1561 family protein [Alkalihalobacterium elongatum]|uniref:SE1561 family protein n=1 Tax=Alkalihalobacterium elongatum TaxID=2675466 RepID=UPI001C1FAB09|nr:SE1561 family protein [Alkalihalobacterium elongatum]
MGGAVNDKNEQLNYLNQKIQMIGDLLDAIEPEDTTVEDIDRILEMLDQLEGKCKVFRNSWESKGAE